MKKREKDKTLNTNVTTVVRSEMKYAVVSRVRADVIRHSSPPHAVSVPFTPRDSNGMGRGIT